MIARTSDAIAGVLQRAGGIAFVLTARLDAVRQRAWMAARALDWLGERAGSHSPAERHREPELVAELDAAAKHLVRLADVAYAVERRLDRVEDRTRRVGLALDDAARRVHERGHIAHCWLTDLNHDLNGGSRARRHPRP